MNIFHKLTRRSLAKNRTRTLVTIIGIILSTAMFTAVAALISSAQAFMLESAIASTGNWHGVYYSAAESISSELAAMDDIEDGSIKRAQVLGFAEFEDIKNDYKPYIFVLGAQEGFFDEMGIYLKDGRLPENPGEIIVPAHLSQNGSVTLETGARIDLDLGDRCSSDGTTLVQTKERQTDDAGNITESLILRESRTYTVVGHYDRPSWEDYSSPGYTLITVADDDPAGYLFDTYFRMEKPRNTYTFMSSNNLGMDWKANSDVLMLLGSSAYDGFYAFLYGFAAILVVLIMFGSISLIYNAFSISVSERTKQFGLLSSVGATKKQIRASVIYEALLVSLVGIPLGIISGIAGIGITLHFIGGMFTDIFSSATDIPLKLSVSPLSILAAAVIALITILISVRIPARRAMKVTAIEAIRQTQDVRIKRKDVKTGKLTQKLFGLEGTLARKNYKRSKKSYRATVVSLFMSIVLFISASSFCYYLTHSVEGASNVTDFDLRYTYYPSRDNLGDMTTQELGELLSAVEGVENSTTLARLHGGWEVPEEYMSDELSELLSMNEDGSFEMSAIIYIVDDASYEKYLNENGLDKSTYMNPENPVFIGNHALRYMSGTSTIRNRNIFQDDKPRTVSVSMTNYDKQEEYEQTRDPESEFYDYDLISDDISMNIALFADTLAPGTADSVGYGLNLMISESCADAAFGGISLYWDNSLQYVFTVSDHKSVYDKMTTVLSENGLETYTLFNYAENEESMRSLVTIINVLSYGFIILISLISIANVFNTVSTNISLRRREFAMLKSVGMTGGGFNRMMNFECLLYGIKALLYGLPVSIAMTFLIFKSATGSYEQGFTLPLTPVIVAVLSVFIVVFVTMMYSMRKIKKDNPIEALKLETL